MRFIQFLSFITVLLATDFSFVTLFFLILIFGCFDYYFFNDSESVDFITLVLFLNATAVFILTATDFINLILAIECLGFGSYALVSFLRNNKLSVQGGIKYLIVGAIPTFFFFLGFLSCLKFCGTISFEFLENLIDFNWNTSTLSEKVENF